MAPKRQSSPSGAAVPDTVACPFTGEPLEIVCLEAGEYSIPMWQGRGKFWSTRIFKEKRSLMWHLGHRDGKAPGFTETVEIKVREREEPAPDPAQEDRDRAKELEDASTEVVNRVARDVLGAR